MSRRITALLHNSPTRVRDIHNWRGICFKLNLIQLSIFLLHTARAGAHVDGLIGGVKAK